MTAAMLYDLIKRRHDGPGWIVLPEVANGTGGSAKRRADALAIGLWPSHGHAIHGFETKVSRSDVKAELADPSKADAVGAFVDYWWLVVGDLQIIDGIVLPETWGVLYPKKGVLRVHAKAPKRKARPIDRGFQASIIRSVVEGWVPKDEHRALKENAKEIARKEVAQEREWKQTEMNHELEALRAKVRNFSEHSGIDLESMSTWGWETENIGKAAKAVVDARAIHGRRPPSEAATLVRGELFELERAAQRHDVAAAGMRSARTAVESLLERLTAPEPDELSGWARQVAAEPVAEEEPGRGLLRGIG